MPVVSSTARIFTTWSSRQCPFKYQPVPVVLSEILPDRLSDPDTAMMVTDGDVEWGAAASQRRKWVARQDYGPFPFNWRVRTAYSDTAGLWHELPTLGIDEDHCAIAPLSEHSAMTVYVGQSGLAWARAVDGSWVEQGVLDSRPWTAAHPKLRIRPSGGLWLLWTENYWVHVSMYDGARWWRGDSLVAPHPTGETYWASWCDVSRDSDELPVLVWTDLGYGYTYRNVVSISFPGEDGWTAGEEIPGSDGYQAPFPPVVTRDRNGDAWVAWSLIGVGGNYVVHTYAKATSSPPRLSGAGPGRTVAWTLSEPAPETWWAVLRAVNGGSFESVARVRAGASAEMSYTDTPPVAGLLAYKIRRECVDARYVWESTAVTVGAGSRPPIYLGPPSGAPDTEPEGNLGERRWSGLRFSLQGAEPGPLSARVYDLQGRVVLERSGTARGGEEPFAFDLADARRTLAQGIYFLRVSDATGRASNAVRFVILK